MMRWLCVLALAGLGAHARQSPFEPQRDGWDFSIGTYWMQMDEDLRVFRRPRDGPPPPARPPPVVPRPPPVRRSNGLTKMEMAKFFIRLIRNSKLSTPAENNGSDEVYMKLVDDCFEKYDKDMTGEIEFDELSDDIITDIMKGYVKYTGDKVMSDKPERPTFAGRKKNKPATAADLVADEYQ